MYFRQQRLQFRSVGECSGLGAGLRCIRSNEVSALPRLWRFRRQQPFHIAVAHDQAGNLRTRLQYKLGTEMNIVAKIVDAELQAFERECGRVPGQARKCRYWLCLSEAEDR